METSLSLQNDSADVTTIIEKTNNMYLSVLENLGLPTEGILSSIAERKSAIRNLPDVIFGIQNLNDAYYISKFLVENKVKVKKLIFVCGFNNYLGINEEYDAVNKSMYFNNLEDVKKYANEIICFYSDNDPYVKYESEKDYADKIATEQVFIPNAGHINSESGYDTFEDIVSYL